MYDTIASWMMAGGPLDDHDPERWRHRRVEVAGAPCTDRPERRMLRSIARRLSPGRSPEPAPCLTATCAAC
jgi:hypothetical protein